MPFYVTESSGAPVAVKPLGVNSLLPLKFPFLKTGVESVVKAEAIITSTTDAKKVGTIMAICPGQLVNQSIPTPFFLYGKQQQIVMIKISFSWAVSRISRGVPPSHHVDVVLYYAICSPNSQIDSCDRHHCNDICPA